MITQGIIFILLIFGIFLFSRKVTSELYISLKRLIGIDRVIFLLIASIYFPGTVIHELSHFFVATALLLKVKTISFIPQWKGNTLRLGSVFYEKKDFIRSIIIGIAPFFGGLTFFWVIAATRIFPHGSLLVNLLMVYLIFTVSSMMFSSSQDLRDFIFLLPFSVIAMGFVYIFDIRFETFISFPIIFGAMNQFFNVVNHYLFISFIINIGVMFFLKIIRNFI